jgi:predicted metal-binding protein
MIEAFGIPLGTVFQGGTLLTAVVIGVGLWIRGHPDRTRAKNEGRVIDDADDEKRRKEWRKEIHDIRNELNVSAAELSKCNKLAVAAITLNEQMMFLFELLLSELEHSDPASKIVQRARLMFNRISSDLKDPSKSNALNAAENTVEAAKSVVEEVKQAENGK